MFLITPDPIDVSVLSSVLTEEDGALATFLGVVRRTSHGQQVRGIHYEAYVPMAMASFKKIATEIKERYSVERLAIIHRTGLVKVGEVAVAIGAAFPHRRQA